MKQNAQNENSESGNPRP